MLFILHILYFIFYILKHVPKYKNIYTFVRKQGLQNHAYNNIVNNCTYIILITIYLCDIKNYSDAKYNNLLLKCNRNTKYNLLSTCYWNSNKDDQAPHHNWNRKRSQLSCRFTLDTKQKLRIKESLILVPCLYSSLYSRRHKFKKQKILRDYMQKNNWIIERPYMKINFQFFKLIFSKIISHKNFILKIFLNVFYLLLYEELPYFSLVLIFTVHVLCLLYVLYVTKILD